VRVDVNIVRGALGPALPLRVEGEGAILHFEGVVRGLENGRPLQALDYEDYEPMTRRALSTLAHEIADEHQLLGIQVEHSIGRVPVGETSFRLQVASKHRAEGIAAVDAFINRLKQEVPLWKVAVFADAAGGAGPEQGAAENEHAGHEGA